MSSFFVSLSLSDSTCFLSLLWAESPAFVPTKGYLLFDSNMRDVLFGLITQV